MSSKIIIGPCDVKECSWKHTCAHFCVCVCLCLRHSNVELLCCFRFPHPLLTAVSLANFSHLLFNLLVILDITASASHLLKPLVFVLLSGREFLRPWLMDFYPQKQQTVLLLFALFYSTPVGPYSSHFQLDKNNSSGVHDIHSKYYTNRSVEAMIPAVACYNSWVIHEGQVWHITNKSDYVWKMSLCMWEQSKNNGWIPSIDCIIPAVCYFKLLIETTDKVPLII